MKWHLPSSSSADHRGKTDRRSINEHTAAFDYNKELSIKLTIDKNATLQPCDIHFEVLQEYHDSGRGGRVQLGNVTLNLAEYTSANDSNILDDPDAEHGMITRRYLMQESKVNATLKIGIAMRQVEGDTNFIAPALRSAMMVGGIAGIMSTEPGEPDDMKGIASKSRELSEAQDIYRQTLAAAWACERGALAPDKLIEDLFAGGDGGKMTVPKQFRPVFENWRNPGVDDSSNSSDTDARNGHSMGLLDPESARTGHRRGTSSGSGHEVSGLSAPMANAVSGRGSIEQQMQHSQHSHSNHPHRDRMHHGHHRRKGQREYREITEFDLREDLRSWEIHAH